MWYVYILFCKDKIKIGRTKNIKTRINNLQVGNPYNMECIYKIKCGDKYSAIYNEKLLHLIFETYQVNREWYEYSRELELFIKNKHWAHKMIQTEPMECKTSPTMWMYIADIVYKNRHLFKDERDNLLKYAW